MTRPTLADVQADYTVLDRLRLEDIPGGAVVLTEDFPPPRNRRGRRARSPSPPPA